MTGLPPIKGPWRLLIGDRGVASGEGKRPGLGPIAEVFASDDFKARWLAEANARGPWAVADRTPSSGAYEDDIRTAISDVREHYGVDISRELARLFLPPPRVDVDIAHLAREMRKANPAQNRHERRANAARGRRR